MVEKDIEHIRTEIEHIHTEIWNLYTRVKRGNIDNKKIRTMLREVVEYIEKKMI